MRFLKKMVLIPSFQIDNVNPSLYFFGYPYEIGDIVFADSTLYKDYVFDSIWAKLHKNRKFYNFFVGEKGVEVFTLYSNFSVSKEIVFYDDKDFKNKIKKYNNYSLCKKSIEIYNKNKEFEISFQEKIGLKDILKSIFSIISIIAFFAILAGVFYIESKCSKDAHIYFDMFISLVIWIATFGYIHDKYIDKKECL